ncbi:MAG TPA: tetratricopeptide repeat protein, partial [bacterium]|nr:tetratricopeptide repeat protein [bacterium]
MKVLYWLVGIACLLSGCTTINQQVTHDAALKFYIQGLIYESSMDFDNALLLYQKSLKNNPENSFLLGKTGKILLKEKRYKEAEDVFKQAINLNPDEAENFFNLGMTYFFLKSYENAISNIEKGLSIQEIPSYRVILCDLYVITGKLDKAIESYKILINSFPSNFLLYYNYGLLLERMGKSDEAETALIESIKIQPFFAAAHIQLGALYNDQNNVESAIKYYNNAIEISPQDPSGYEGLAQLYIGRKMLDEATLILKMAIAKGVESGEINYMLGFISFQQQQYQDAELYYKKTLRFAETSMVWFSLGITYDKLNKKEETEDCMRKAIKMDETNHLALNYLGYFMLIENKNTDEALSLIQKAVRLDPDNGAYLDSLGWAYYK